MDVENFLTLFLDVLFSSALSSTEGAVVHTGHGGGGEAVLRRPLGGGRPGRPHRCRTVRDERIVRRPQPPATTSRRRSVLLGAVRSGGERAKSGRRGGGRRLKFRPEKPAG